jgi:hypothetical protein
LKPEVDLTKIGTLSAANAGLPVLPRRRTGEDKGPGSSNTVRPTGMGFTEVDQFLG